MNSAILHELKKVSVGEMPEVELADGEVRLRVELCGVCGSDIKTYLRGTPYMTLPGVLGHEVVGTVIESKNKKWRKNDRVAVAHYIPCGSCEYCLSGKGTICPELFKRRISPGGFAEYLRVPHDLADRGMFKLSDDVEFEQAVLAEPLACCIHGAKVVGIPEGSTVLVIGDGPMGLLHVQTAYAFGARKVIISGMMDNRLKIAKEFTDNIINARTMDVAAEVKEKTNGIGPDVIIVAVASVEVAQQAMDMVRSGGSVLLFGGFPSGSQMTIDPNRIHYDEVNLVGSVGSLPNDFSLALQLLESNKVKSTPLFTNLYSLDQVPLALERGTQQHGVKSLVNPWAPPGTDKKLKSEME